MGKAVIVKENVERLQWDGRCELNFSILSCCCFAEIDGIQRVNDPFTTLVEIATNMEGGPESVMLFTSTNDHLAGDELMDYIHKEKLGKVSFQGPFYNKNSGNNVWLYTWVVDERRFEQFAQKLDELRDNNYKGPF
jgi:hypothetical protein